MEERTDIRNDTEMLNRRLQQYKGAYYWSLHTAPVLPPVEECIFDIPFYISMFNGSVLQGILAKWDPGPSRDLNGTSRDPKRDLPGP